MPVPLLTINHYTLMIKKAFITFEFQQGILLSIIIRLQTNLLHFLIRLMRYLTMLNGKKHLKLHILHISPSSKSSDL